MKNTHLQHPEDAILTGDFTVLDWFICQDSQLSTKIDGAPAIVWGATMMSCVIDSRKTYVSVLGV